MDAPYENNGMLLYRHGEDSPLLASTLVRLSFGRGEAASAGQFESSPTSGKQMNMHACADGPYVAGVRPKLEGN